MFFRSLVLFLYFVNIAGEANILLFRTPINYVVELGNKKMFLPRVLNISQILLPKHASWPY